MYVSYLLAGCDLRQLFEGLHERSNYDEPTREGWLPDRELTFPTPDVLTRGSVEIRRKVKDVQIEEVRPTTSGSHSVSSKRSKGSKKSSHVAPRPKEKRQQVAAFETVEEDDSRVSVSIDTEDTAVDALRSVVAFIQAIR